MPQVSISVSDDVFAALERGRQKRSYIDKTEYVTALILEGADLTSGLDADGVLARTANLTKIAQAVSAAEDALPAYASGVLIAALKQARKLIVDAILENKNAVDAITQQRLRIRGGDTSWTTSGKRTT